MTIERFGLDPDGQRGLSKDDVVNLHGTWFGLTTNMVKLEELINYIVDWSRRSQAMKRENPWFSEKGCECEILRTKGGGWQKGRLRFRLEFIPDDPAAFLEDSTGEADKMQSPLDDLRSQLGK